MPLFVRQVVNLPKDLPVTKAINRKTESLQLELLRAFKIQLREKERTVNQSRGYNYLCVTRTWKKEAAKELFVKVEKALAREQHLILERHRKKWSALRSGSSYPCEASDYFVNSRPIFPFVHVDDFLFEHVRVPSSNDTGLHERVFDTAFFTSNETELTLSSTVQTCLSKGPRYRVPPNLLSKDFLTVVDKQLDKFKYNFRWNDKMNHKQESSSNQTLIPFFKNTVSLPPKMITEKEHKLQFFKDKALEIIHNESKSLKNDKKFKQDTAMIRNTKRFLSNNEVEARASDKTNRFVVANSDSLLNRTENILKDVNNYCKIDKDNIAKIENQANSIIRSTCSHLFTKSDFEKLLTTGSHPASFYVKIKDHKDKDEMNNYPLRPIASSTDTPTSKIDWLVTKILSQLTSFVATNIKNAISLIENLKTLSITPNSESTFISLDVISLYPSIPIQHGIEVVSDFLKTNWNRIDTLGFSFDDVLKCLKFICYNYYIQYNNVTYRQIKGCPMGARFSPPFAIIYMYYIEQEALKILDKDHKISPQYYGRYIDDIIIGPLLINDPNSINKLLSVFNSVSQDIKFTLEVPKNRYLNFLDVSIGVGDTGLDYKWFVKSMRSNITLNKHSWVPHHVKSNYIKNSKTYVTERCSDQNKKDDAISKLNRRFKQNGFTNRDIAICTKNKNKNTDDNFVPCKLNFVSDRCNRKLNKLIQQCDLPIKLVSKPGPTLETVLSKKSKNTKHNDCHVCGILPANIICSDRFLVYKFSCNLCDAFYIGQTNRPISKRYNEHKRDLTNKNKKNALYEHGSKVHNFSDITISHFDIDILDRSQNAVDCRLAEARLIKTLQPGINRKHELPNF